MACSSCGQTLSGHGWWAAACEDCQHLEYLRSTPQYWQQYGLGGIGYGGNGLGKIGGAGSPGGGGKGRSRAYVRTDDPTYDSVAELDEAA